MSKCADPVLCYTQNGARKFRHFSLASPIVKLHHDLVFDCGKCIFCRKKKSYEIAVRCVLHASLYQHNCFLTLTYDEKKPGYHNDLQYEDVQNFKKKLRNLYRVPYSDIRTRKLRYVLTRKVQIFNVHEYGKNGKKHWHLVVFNHDFEDKELHTISNGNRLYKSALLSRLWPHGFASIGDVTEASAMYQAQYTQKDVKNGNSNNNRKSHSKHSGIGRDYFLNHYAQLLALGFIPVGGQKVPLPRYFLKLAHRHYSHFYEPSNFYDVKDRKRLYSPFKPGEENKEIADLYIQLKNNKKDFLEEKIKEWNDFVKQNAFSKDKPDFLKAAENYLYDLDNKKALKDF